MSEEENNIEIDGGTSINQLMKMKPSKKHINEEEEIVVKENNKVSEDIDITDLDLDTEPKEKDSSYFYFIPEMYREFIIFMVVYFVLSLSVVSELFATYLPQNDMISIIVSGTLLYVIFNYVRKYFFKE